MTAHSETPPPAPGWWNLLTTVNRTGPRWPAASRAALAVALPALIAYLAGREDAMLMIAGGGFTVIFGEGLPFRTRWRVMATAGTLLVLGSVAGGFVGTVVWAQNDGDPGWWLLLIAAFTTGVAGLAGFAQNALRLPPPGTFFMVMLAGGSTMIAKQDWNPVEAGLWTALGASFAVCVWSCRWLMCFPAVGPPSRPGTVTAFRSGISRCTRTCFCRVGSRWVTSSTSGSALMLSRGRSRR